MQFENLAAESHQQSQPWKTDNVETCTELFDIQKGQYSQYTLRQTWQKHAREHENTPMFYTDGSKSENGTEHSVRRHNTIQAEKISDRCSIHTAELC